ncbi:MAG: chemotaxis protein CheW [Phycisphaerae bacterium]|nr:chemotaxis protein CheW [Phycisphaerae bacterium]
MTERDTRQSDADDIDLNAVMAQLVGLLPSDRAEVTALAELLQSAASDASPVAAISGPLTDAAATLLQAVAGTPDGEALLTQAANLVGQALLAVEACQQQEAEAAQNEAPPAPAVVDDAAHRLAVTIAAAPHPVANPPQSAANQTPTPPPAAMPPMEFPSTIVPADIDVELLKEYISECLDHVASAEAALLQLESYPDDSDEPINTIFRAYHTIKGTSGMLNIAPVQRLAHLSENLLDKARSKQLHLVGGYADLCFKSCDQIKAMVKSLRDATPGGQFPLPAGYDMLLNMLQNPEASGVNRSGVHNSLRVGDILVATAKVDRATIEKAIGELNGKPLGQVLIERGDVKPQDVAAALRTQRQLESTASGDGVRFESTVRVNTERLDTLIDMVGEIVIAHSMVVQDPDVAGGGGLRPRLQRNVVHTAKILRSLQDLATSLRMVPLKASFQKIARLVRDLARTTGKNIQLVTSGEDTEIDRNMVEVLNDPLIHMIRNAVDHGIEPTEARIAFGKSPQGTIHLRASQSAGNVVIELQDDGKGLDTNRILAKAVERGLVSANAEMSEHDIHRMIFLPGFSTADKVTDVSGRGVGMDVVKRNVEAIRGRLDIAATPGEGTLFTLRLPLTMAIIDAMLVKIGRQTYMLPTVSIVRSFRPEPGMISTVAGRGEMVTLRGELMPMFRLHNLFNVSDAQTDPLRGLLMVVQCGAKHVALMVDELLGQQQVVIKSLGRSLSNIQGISGGAIMGDGRVGLILDVAGIVAVAQGEDEVQPQAA